MRTAAALAALTAILAGCGGDCPRVRAPSPSEARRVLLEPGGEAFTREAPDTFRVRLTTSAGDVVLEVVRAWAPIGADRFYNLVRHGFFDGNRFFRVLPGFIVQFGVHGVPAIQAAWNQSPLPDDAGVQSNVRGTLTYATAGPGTRTTQLFINYRDNERLDAMGFAPIGRVVEGMGTLLRLYGDYGEFAPQGAGPSYACMLSGGNAYLDRRFERLDSIATATVLE